MPSGQILTFYSYNGGVGRTFALANVAVLLARWGYRVLCVDWDLEALGLDLYFTDKPGVELELELGGGGLATAIDDFRRGRRPELDWRRYAVDVGLAGARGKLVLLPSGRHVHGYFELIQRIDWDKLYNRKLSLGHALERVREDWIEAFDFVLIDSRTGVTDVGGICTIQLPDVLVLLGAANQQNLQGLRRVLELTDAPRDALQFDRAPLKALPLLTRFDTRTEYEESQEWLNRFAETFSARVGEWAHRETSARALMSRLKIPHVPYWSFGERLPIVEEPTERTDPESVITGAIDFVATVDDENFEAWELAYRRSGDTEWTDWDQGSQPIVNGVVTQVDPTLLPNGFYEIRLLARDVNGLTASITWPYEIDSVKLGEFNLELTDMIVPFQGMSVTVVRAYDSRVRIKQDFGVGWKLAVKQGRFETNRALGEAWNVAAGGGFFNWPCGVTQELAQHKIRLELSPTESYEFEAVATLPSQLPVTGGLCQAVISFNFVNSSMAPFRACPRSSLSARAWAFTIRAATTWPKISSLWTASSTSPTSA